MEKIASLERHVEIATEMFQGAVRVAKMVDRPWAWAGGGRASHYLTQRQMALRSVQLSG